MSARKNSKGEVPEKNDDAGKRQVKKASAGRKKKSPPWAVLFWLAFAIFIFGFFLFNKDTIFRGIQTVQNALVSQNAGKPPDLPPEPELEQTAATAPRAGSPETRATRASEPVRPTQPATQAPTQAPTQGSASRPSAPNTQGQTGQSAQPTQNRDPELRDRVLYFTQVDRSGAILRVKVERRLPVSDTPMIDVLKSLLSGPTPEEKQKGLISLIPQGVRILSATVRGNTAYINFSEDFQYNTYGVEGYAGQLRQIVFTATEFSNVGDVQILIEGNRVDYLGEGIWIGSPLSRDSLH